MLPAEASILKRTDSPNPMAGACALERFGQGMCGACRSKLVAGRVDMKHAGGIRQRQIDLGFILPCCSKPLTDITLER
jgi:ferredoxin